MPVARSCAGVAVGGVSPPPSFFSCGLPGCGGGGLRALSPALLCCGSVAVAVACLGLGPLCLRLPSPLRLGFFYFSFFLLCPCPCGRWPATSPVGVCAAVSGVSFPPSHRRLCGCGGRLFLAGRLRAGRGGPPVSYRRALRVSPLVLPGWEVARLCGVGARLRGCATAPPVFLLSRWPAGVRSLLGGASPLLSFFYWGGFACSFVCLPWPGARTGRQTLWLTLLLLVLWVAAGRALAPWVVWVMYTHGLVACPIGLGSGSAPSAVVPAGFVWSWVRVVGLSRVPLHLPCRFGGGGLNFPVAVCAGGPPLAGWGGCCTYGRVVASSPCVVGWCAVVPRQWACPLPFQDVRRLDLVRPTVSVPCFGAVVCFGVPCCIVLCSAVLRRAVMRCAAVHPALLCRAVPCRAVVCLAMAWRVAPCCAAPRCVVLCCVVSLAALSPCAPRGCALLRCAVLLRVVPCFAVLCCVVGPSYLRSSVGWRRRWLDWWLCCVGRGLRLCGWLVAGGVVWRGAARWVCVAGVWACRSVWLVRRVSTG